jgi:hypothetical protein
MAELLLVAAAFAAGYLGFTLLALSLERHRRELIGAAAAPPRRRATLRLAGSAALALAFGLAVMRDGAGFGSVLGVLLLAWCAAGVALTLGWRPNWLVAVARALR